MSNICELKNKALAQLKGNWTNAVILTLIYVALTGVCGALSYVLVGVLLLVLLKAGYSIAMLTFYRGKHDILTDELFEPFKDFKRYLPTMLLVFVYTMLWSFLLVIPGIIKGLSYSLTPFIMKDNPNIKNNEAIELSMKMMDGYKWKLFLLQLSFIGWIVLGTLTFGIGLLWVQAYMHNTVAAFYEERKAEFEA